MTVRSPDRSGARRPFVVMAKPVGSACNMRCSYCYYLHTSGSSPTRRMSPETLERMIRSYIASAEGPVISFTWHGGEPMLAGLDFYRLAVDIQRRSLPDGWECWNSLQTNGLALDEDWCRFLAEARFDVGVSIDGTQAVHDAFRASADGSPTYDRIAENIRLLQAHGIRPDLLCTVTSRTAEAGVEVYRSLRDLDTGWMQFIPIVRWREDGTLTEDSVTPKAYGTFLKNVFAEWFFHDMERTEVQLFSETALALSGQEPNLCWMRATCGHVPVVEADGSVFACDHFVRPEHRIGSVWEEVLGALVNGPAQTAFGETKRSGLTAACRACPWLKLCGGGCPKDRHALSPDGEPGQYVPCEGLRDYFAYAVPRLKAAMALSAQHRSRREITETLIRAERERFRSVNRNDPCPCGSGLKFKQCCGRRCP
ncbi:MAG: anaerobic sulfatase maturase [Clostridia bacterium]|nr:anaerobic sulfatase maturase [Clostridia bacterium]